MSDQVDYDSGFGMAPIKTEGKMFVWGYPNISLALERSSPLSRELERYIKDKNVSYNKYAQNKVVKFLEKIGVIR